MKQLSLQTQTGIISGSKDEINHSGADVEEKDGSFSGRSNLGNENRNFWERLQWLNDGKTTRPCISLRSLKISTYILFLKQNNSIQFLEVFCEFSLHRKEKSRKRSRINAR